MNRPTKEAEDKALDQMVLRIEITSLEAAAIYGAVMALRHTDPTAHDSVIAKLKAAQERAIAELVRAEVAQGPKQ